MIRFIMPESNNCLEHGDYDDRYFAAHMRSEYESP